MTRYTEFYLVKQISLHAVSTGIILGENGITYIFAECEYIERICIISYHITMYHDMIKCAYI